MDLLDAGTTPTHHAPADTSNADDFASLAELVELVPVRPATRDRGGAQ